jgi:hypothetical protein
MTAPRAGPMPITISLMGEVSFRRGERERNPRKGEIREVKFSVDEGFAVLEQKILRYLREPPFSNDGTQLLEQVVYFKASKNAAQSAYKRLDDVSFDLLLRERWGNITQADVDRLADGEEDPVLVAASVAAGFAFQFFVYVSSGAAASAPALRRATAARIVESTQAIAEFARSNQIGPITTNHLIVTHARQPEGTAVRLPDDNTTRQARALDDAIRDMAAPPTDDVDTELIEVEIGGAWVSLRVRVSSLRAALRLPAHDIFTRGIFHGFTPAVETPVDADMEDEDHQSDGEMIV